MRYLRALVAVTVILTGTAVPSTIADGAPADHVAGVEITLPDEVIQALERDLGLTEAEVLNELAAQAVAADVVGELEARIDADFGGAWLDDNGNLMVGVADAAQADVVLAAGAQPAVVTFSEAQLDGVHAALDRREATAPDGVVGWHVDVTTNSVTILTDLDGVEAAEAFVAAAGVDEAAVTVEVTHAQPELFQQAYPVRGGDAYYTPQYRCSIGFSVRGGYTTAGHCGNVGTTTSGYNRVNQGVFRGSRFPGSDEAWVQVNQNWSPQPVVNNYRGGTVAVRGSQVAPIGATVCRSGSTTGWRCGTLQARNQTVRYPQGTVFGLTRTSACAQGGDSGGAFMWGNQAQGMTSGGSGNCFFGGTTFFQPVNPTLQRYGLTLLTA